MGLVVPNGHVEHVEQFFPFFFGHLLEWDWVGVGLDGNPGSSNPWQLTLHSYDDEGRVADKWIWTGDKREWDTHMGYEYNRQGEVIKRTVTVGSQTLHQHYAYNQRGLLASVTVTTDGTADTESPEVTYTYTATGAIENIDFKGNKDVDYGYTIRDWVESINDISNPGGNFAGFYDYYDNGNVKNADFHNPDTGPDGVQSRYNYTFGYDGLNRLKQADYSFPGFANMSNHFDVRNLDYDPSGNIKALQRWGDASGSLDNLTYNYEDGTNRLHMVADNAAVDTTDWAAKGATFDYDDNGNLTSQTGKLTNVAYEHRNLPIHFYLNSGDELIANYNADGQRILKESSGGSYSFYLMDGQQTLGVIQDDTLRHLNLVGNSTFGRWEPGGARRYYITDHLGSTRAVVDNNGTVLETFDYYPGGLHMPQRTSTTGYTIEKFTGKERDENIGLDYFGARYYDPALWRWTSTDPRANDYPSWSPYNYALNNPTGNIDPDGEFVLSFLSGFARGIFSGKRIGESFNMGVQSVKNSVGILSSFVRGNFGQIVSKFTWQLPQQALGVLGGNIRNFAGDVRNISHSDGATLIETNSSGWGGFTLGSVIQAQKNTRIGSNLYRHEYGHYLQSQRLGPAYLPIIGIPSLGSAVINNYDGHTRFYTERWADRLSERFFDDKTQERSSNANQRLRELVRQAMEEQGFPQRYKIKDEEDEFE